MARVKDFGSRDIRERTERASDRTREERERNRDRGGARDERGTTRTPQRSASPGGMAEALARIRQQDEQNTREYQERTRMERAEAMTPSTYAPGVVAANPLTKLQTNVAGGLGALGSTFGITGTGGLWRKIMEMYNKSKAKSAAGAAGAGNEAAGLGIGFAGQIGGQTVAGPERVGAARSGIFDRGSGTGGRGGVINSGIVREPSLEDKNAPIHQTTQPYRGDIATTMPVPQPGGPVPQQPAPAPQAQQGGLWQSLMGQLRVGGSPLSGREPGVPIEQGGAGDLATTMPVPEGRRGGPEGPIYIPTNRGTVPNYSPMVQKMLEARGGRYGR